MFQSHVTRTGACLFMILVLVAVASKSPADSLSMEEAGVLAIKGDYTLKAIQARGQSVAELAIATGSMPDPQLKLGFANLPTDSFNLGQEPMTQTVIGIRQAFPRGHTRALTRQRLSGAAAGKSAEAEDRAQQVLLETRSAYVKLYLHRERERILQQSKNVFSNLAEITRDYYASGRAHQQHVVQADLELARVDERLAGIRQEINQAQARLAEYIGPEAYRELYPGWPVLDQPQPVQQTIAGLPDHPRLRAWQQQVETARISEDIARQAYKPGFALEMAYGGRGGSNTDGSDRSDFLSAFVTMDIPLFTKNRQDRALASSIAETSSVEFARDNIYRAMKARVEEQNSALKGKNERLGMYEELLLPQAAFNAESAFEAYRDAVGDLTTLMRAQIGEYELKLDHANLRADVILTRAQLLYLQGETS